MPVTKREGDSPQNSHDMYGGGWKEKDIIAQLVDIVITSTEAYMQRANIQNERFGMLTAIGPTDQRNFGNVIWKCRCDCGKIVYKSTSYLSKDCHRVSVCGGNQL